VDGLRARWGARTPRAPQRRLTLSLIAIGIVTALAVGRLRHLRCALASMGLDRPVPRCGGRVRGRSWGMGGSPASPGSSGSHSVTPCTGRIFDAIPVALLLVA